MSITADQRLLALQRANEIRTGMAKVRKNIRVLPTREGRELVSTLLEHPSGFVPSMRIGVLLGSIQKVGRHKVGGMLSAAGIRSADRHVSELTDRQKGILIDALRAKASRSLMVTERMPR